MPNQSVWFDDKEYRHVADQSDEEDESFSGYIRSLIRRDMQTEENEGVSDDA